MTSDAETTSLEGVGPCRRQRRAESGPKAVRYQLQKVAEGLSLDAIVLADDLGRVLAHAGSTQLSQMLASAAIITTIGDLDRARAGTAGTRALNWAAVGREATTALFASPAASDTI